ncbi:MAG TPA: hypothetical protein PKN99_06825 [Cyclobacteriaceae bacterium]|nr:hypothetical protein [Cyclobacteriaceae bacterium]
MDFKSKLINNIGYIGILGCQLTAMIMVVPACSQSISQQLQNYTDQLRQSQSVPILTLREEKNPRNSLNQHRNISLIPSQELGYECTLWLVMLGQYSSPYSSPSESLCGGKRESKGL